MDSSEAIKEVTGIAYFFHGFREKCVMEKFIKCLDHTNQSNHNTQQDIVMGETFLCMTLQH